MAQQHAHLLDVPANIVGQDSGFQECSHRFRSHFDPILLLPNNGDLTCAACCWSYLVGRRQYQHDLGVTQVYYNHGTTSCYVDGPQGPNGVNPVVKTGRDINLGDIGPRPVQQSISYQLYLPPEVDVGTLAVGKNITARIESISVTRLSQPNQVNDCYFNYADAALMELYLERGGRPSFQGTCSSLASEVDQLAGQVRMMNVGQSGLTDDQ